jgi:HK97 family phage major capsid protein
MDETLRNALIAEGLKADATDEEAKAFMKEKNIKVVETPKVDTKNDVSEIKNEIKNMQASINLRLDEQDASIGTMLSDVRDNKDDDPQCGYRNHIEFFNDVIAAGISGKPSDKLNAAQEILRRNAVGSDEAKVSNNPDGGFLVPPAYMPGVMTTDPNALQVDTGAMTRNIPMESDVVYVNARVDKDHSSSVTGGFQVYRREETASVTATKGKFEQIKLEANSLMGLSYATEEILARSPSSFVALIQSGFNEEKTSKLNYERLWGTGVGEFMGVFNSPAKIEQAKESGQTAGTIVGANIVKMRSRIWGYNNAIWMANQDCYEQLTSLHISGTNGDVFLFNPARGIDVPDTLLGRPIIFDENMATVGDAGDISLINWREYLEGQLGGASFAESIHVRFVNNERAFRFVIYNAGAPWWRSALTPKKSTTTLSPIITLAARA